MRPWPPVRITVLKTMYNQDLAEEYRRPDIHTGPCPYFGEGQEFVSEQLRKPEDFGCDWAWNDIYNAYLTLAKDGSNYTPWMKNSNSVIRCCNDGIRPVVFMIERIED